MTDMPFNVRIVKVLVSVLTIKINIHAENVAKTVSVFTGVINLNA